MAVPRPGGRWLIEAEDCEKVYSRSTRLFTPRPSRLRTCV
jgi:hypothetical protein